VIRFILRNQRRDEYSRATVDCLFTIDGDVVALEQALRRGGYGESGYDLTSLVGVEVLDDPVLQNTNGGGEVAHG
jgi:hypothetical protein